MVHIRSTIHRTLPQLVLAAAFCFAPAEAQKFYPDDPIRAVPPPMSATVVPRGTDVLYDFLRQSFRPDPRPALPALGVNTLGEVPDSEWYTNRHAARRMTLDELRRGPGDAYPPQPPFKVVGGKVEGITPGFRMVDSRGALYFVKPDPRSNPEMATAADVIGSRFFYALGYNTPENYIVRIKPDEMEISTDARVNGLDSKQRAMHRRDLADILRNVPRASDGTLRVLASKALDGEPIGPFRYEKTRHDDTNDTIPHERRRELRGLHVFCAWLNHTDAKALNTLDLLVNENGRTFVRHYLIDFGAMLGSDSDMPKNARFGNEYVIPKAGQALGRMVAFGLDVKPWERTDYGDIRSVGRFQAAVFDPELWKSNYPNPAFLSRQPDDEYWAAKIVMAFTEEEIRAIVDTGQYSDERAVGYITRTLVARRDRIGRAYLAKVLPLEGFTVESGQLRFEDLALRYGYGEPRDFTIAWATFDNDTGSMTPISGASGPRVPDSSATYLAATINADNDSRKKVTAYLRRNGTGWDIVGIDRTS